MSTDENTCGCCKKTKAPHEMEGYCPSYDKHYCGDCAGMRSRCEDIDCDVHWGGDWYECAGCKKFTDGDHETGDVGEICLDRGVFCSDCWDEEHSLEKCRKKGCDMCSILYEKEIADWWRCECCNERKPDVDESVLCGDCRKDMTIEELMTIVTE